MTQHTIPQRRLVLVARRHFACFWVLPPQQNKNQIKMINLQFFFVPATKLPTETRPLPQQTLPRCSQSAKGYPNIYQVPRHTTRLFQKLRCQNASCSETGGKCILPSVLELHKIQPRAFFYNIETH